MYRYYQLEEGKSEWKVARASEIEEKIREEKPKRVAILEVSELVTDGADKRSYYYKGPLYFDIDCKDDLDLALQSGVSLVNKLVSMGVPQQEVQIFASGSKGVHVLVDERVFSSGRKVKALPLVYKQMARELYVPGMDFAVYSCGRGNVFRVPNIKRPDGNYRIPILYDKLTSLNAESYRELCSKPSEISHLLPENKVKALQLEDMFNRCKKAANSKPAVVVTVPSNQMIQLRDVTPPCIQKVCDWKGLRAEVNLNQAAMQVAVFLKAASVPDSLSSGMITRLAENSVSSKYDNWKSRLEHIKGQVEYMKGSEYTFGCNCMRSLLLKRPCEGCPIEKDQAFSEEASHGGLIEKNGGYYLRGAEKDRMITDWTMKPMDSFIDIPQDGSSQPRRVGTLFELIQNDETICTVTVDETSWMSRSGFLRDTTESGYIPLRSPCSYYGQDADLHKIRNHVFRKESDMGEVYQVYTCGIHVDKVSHSDVFTYVEPEMSINSNRVSGTHKLAGRVVARPYFAEVGVCKEGDEAADEALFNLMAMNEPHVMAKTLGWFVACHLKVHLTKVYHQFPVLSLWGGAGSGKSITAGLVSWINGTDYMDRDTGVNVSNITNYALLEYSASTTTIPRLMEEFNESKMSEKAYNSVGEILKASWNGETLLRGTLGNKSDKGRTGAVVTAIPITGPLCVMSEQRPVMPAIQERSLDVFLSKPGKKGRKPYMRKASSGKLKLREIGKALMFKALQTDIKTATKWFDEVDDSLSDELDDRPRYCQMVAMIGLRFLKLVLEKDLKLPKSCARLDDLIYTQQSYFDRLAGDTAILGASTEIDRILDKMAIMASLTTVGNGVEWLVAGVHYLKGGSELLIDPTLCHAMYKQFCARESREVVIIKEAAQFKKLLRDEAYFKEIVRDPNIFDGRELYCLDLESMKMQEIPVDRFEELT